MDGYSQKREEMADDIVLQPSSKMHELFQEKEVEENMLNFIEVLDKAGLTDGNTKDNPADWLHLITELDEKWHDELFALLINPSHKLQLLLDVKRKYFQLEIQYHAHIYHTYLGLGSFPHGLDRTKFPNENEQAIKLWMNCVYAVRGYSLRHGKHTFASSMFPSTVFFVDDLMYNLSLRSHTYTRLFVIEKGDHYRTDLYEALNIYYMTRNNAEDDTFFIEDRIGAVIQKVPETVLCILFLTNKLSFEDAIAYPGKHVAEYICSLEEDPSTIEDDPVAIKQKYLQLIKNSNAFKNFIKTYYLSLYQ